jgi:hypothetical protein
MATIVAKKQLRNYWEKEPWEREMDKFDRAMRRRETRWRRRVIRIDAALMSQLTDNQGNISLSKLNALDPERIF